jgi:hypothetical protein
MSSFTETWLPGPKSTSFYTRTYHPSSGSPTGVVVFIHGFTEHVARYEHVHMRWADRGFVVFTFDQRGFGRTALDPKKSSSAVYGRTGDADQISDIEWALRVAQESNPTVPLFLMGHSMVRPAYVFTIHLLALFFKLDSRLVRSTGRCIGTLVRDASQYAGERCAAVGNYCVKSLYSAHQPPTEYHTPAGRLRTRHPSEPERTSVS